ncbi:peptidylprolyl isomerase [bacterium]|nr:peptidylprolyl isomerase [bacterium]
MKVFSQHYYLSILIPLFFLAACGNDSLPEDVIAIVGDHEITSNDFKRAYLPVLLYSDKKESPQTREETLDFLIDQTILAQAARSLKLDTIPTLEVLRQTAEKAAFTRILYKEWVKEIIPTPTESELRIAFTQSHNSRLVRHLFTVDKAQAYRLHQELGQGADWDSLAALTFNEPYLASNGGVLGWMKFGEMDPLFEKAVYELDPLQISEPVQTRFGWHIIRVDEQTQELMLTEYDYSLERRKLLRIIRERHEQRLADSVINVLMDDAQLIFQPQVAPRVWTVIRDQVQQLLVSDDMQKLSNPELSKFENQLEPLLDEEMLRFYGTIWTVKKFLEKLPEMNRQLMLTDLKTATAYLVRDEIIHTEGLKRNLDRRPEVMGEVKDRENQFLSNLYLRFKADSQPVSRDVIQEYYRQNASTKYQAPDSIYIIELIFENHQKAVEIKTAIIDGLSLEDIYAREEISNEFKLNNLGWFRAAGSDRPDYYHRLVNLPLNTPVGPLSGSQTTILIMATRRHRHAKALEDIFEQVNMDAEDERLGKLRLREVQRLSKEKKIRIDLDKLQNPDWLN